MTAAERIADLERRLAVLESDLAHVDAVAALRAARARAEQLEAFKRLRAERDPAARWAAWSALSPIDRARFELDASAAVDFVAGFDAERRDAILATLAPSVRLRVRVALAPPIPFVSVRLKPGTLHPNGTPARAIRRPAIPVGLRDVADLAAVGLATSRTGRDSAEVPELYLVIDGDHVERRSAWDSRLELDADLAALVAAGTVEVADVAADRARELTVAACAADPALIERLIQGVP